MPNKADFFNNTEGLNLTDSPFYVKDGQATGGYNYDYVKTGGISKILGISPYNTIADTQLNSLGLGIHDTTLLGVKTLIRAAGTKLQVVNTGAATFINQTTDTATPTSDFLTAGSTQPVVFANFNTANADLLWAAGGGMSTVYGYTGSKITANGVAVPSGTFTAVNQGSGTGGTWGAATGIYYYSVALRKASTQAVSNAALDQTITIVTATDSVLLTFPTGIDATLYDKWYVYRSSVGGVTAFTAGSLVAQVTVGTATFTDTNITLSSSQLVPRAGSLLDQSPLPVGTYTTLTSFKRHLVTAAGSTVYISDLNKPESWPLGLQIVIPSGGPITAVSVVGYNSPNTGTTDEFLVVFKEREIYVINGSLIYDSNLGIYDLALLFIDSVGCPNPALVVRAPGFVTWVNTNGVYMWNGAYKPVYVSRPIESLFGYDGGLDKTKLGQSWGLYFNKKKQVIWTLSDRTRGANKIQVKLDLRLTAPSVHSTLASTVCEGIFCMDSYATPLYAGVTYLTTSSDETFVSGDNSGFVYQNYVSVSDNGTGVSFNYTTKPFDMGHPTIAKQFMKVVVWIDRSVARDLTLKYSSSYRNLKAQRSESRQNMDLEFFSGETIAARWDIAVWDASFWDDFTSNVIPLVFNLDSSKNNNQGDSITLDFSQTEVNAPVVIHGFSVFWDLISPRK